MRRYLVAFLTCALAACATSSAPFSPATSSLTSGATARPDRAPVFPVHPTHLELVVNQKAFGKVFLPKLSEPWTPMFLQISHFRCHPQNAVNTGTAYLYAAGSRFVAVIAGSAPHVCTFSIVGLTPKARYSPATVTVTIRKAALL